MKVTPWKGSKILKCNAEMATSGSWSGSAPIYKCTKYCHVLALSYEVRNG